MQDDVVSKPFRIGELVPKIEELASKYPKPLDTVSAATALAAAAPSELPHLI
jgi:DNA-binding response OmpR family regulator